MKVTGVFPAVALMIGGTAAVLSSAQSSAHAASGSGEGKAVHNFSSYSTAQQPSKKTHKQKRARKKARGGVRYNFGTWERDTTYEGYCENSYRLGVPLVSCEDF